jgi:hypothetical protein
MCTGSLSRWAALTSSILFAFMVVPIVVGKRLPPLPRYTFELVRDCVWVIAALPNAISQVEYASLDGIRHHYSDRPHQSSSHLCPSSLYCFLVSRQSTTSLQLRPPYTPQNEIYIFVAPYRSYHVRSLHPGILPQYPSERGRSSMRKQLLPTAHITMLNKVSVMDIAELTSSTAHEPDLANLTRQ